jgi:hypothetical protein
MWLRMRVHTTVHMIDRKPQSFFGDVDLLMAIVKILVMFDVCILVGHL